MTGLLDLPHELIQCILLLCNGSDLGQLACSCRLLNDCIRNNWILHREIWLRDFDELKPEAGKTDGPDWQTALHDVVALQKILETPNAMVKRDDLVTAGNTIMMLIRNANVDYRDASNLKWLARGFGFLTKDSKNVNTLLTSSSLFRLAGHSTKHRPAEEEVQRQLSAKLHVMWGMPITFPSNQRILRSEHVRPTNIYARARVYNLAKYTKATMWGPFLEDGSGNVDWENLEAIFVVLGFNLAELTHRSGNRFPQIWHRPWFGVTPKCWQDPGQPPLQDMAEREETDVVKQDPYDITGTWMRVVCFLDYSDLYSHNFEHPGPEFPDLIETEEATRIIEMNLEATKIEPPGPEDGQDLPVVYFEGRSRSLHDPADAHSSNAIRGTVRLTKEGEVRWTSFSVFHGEERWRSEGIQIGGPATRRGVLGTWFDKDFSAQGPAGPTAFWKISDRLRKRQHLGGMQTHDM